MTEKELFGEKQNCCGCGTCSILCPFSAIEMTPDEYGFVYPTIDNSKCTDCGLCKKSCSYQADNIKKKTVNSYAAITKNTDIKKSASGGIFASMAKSIISLGGTVYGVSLEMINSRLTPIHIKADNENDLLKLMGSKYVQSSAYPCFNQVKEDLDKGITVLFSGTPCQVEGLYSYLKKDYDNLFTIDIICHGVPSSRLFSDYINTLEGKLKGKITDFKFRAKEVGWSITGKAVYQDKNNNSHEKLISCFESSYMSLFLKGETYRENCYSCKYAFSNRAANITIGDYWGIESIHPEYLIENDGFIDSKKGSSCIIINDTQGQRLFEITSNGFECKPSTFESISKYNGQLTSPSKHSDNRYIYLSAYKEGGYRQLEKTFNSKNRNEILISKLKLKAKLMLKKIGLYN